MDTKREDLQINGKIVSVSTEGVVADALQIYDDGMLRYVNTGRQNDINQYLKNKVDVLTDNVYNINTRIDNIQINRALNTFGVESSAILLILAIMAKFQLHSYLLTQMMLKSTKVCLHSLVRVKKVRYMQQKIPILHIDGVALHMLK